GLTGSNGVDGAVGATGPQGTDGAAGPKGDIGLTGPAGTNGIDGPKGDKGDTGNPAPVYTAGTGINVDNTAHVISALNTTALWNANQLQGRPINAVAPTNNQVLTWDGSNWTPASTNAEPWRVTGTANEANSNTQDIYQTGNISIGTSAATAYRLNVFGGHQLISGIVAPRLNFLSNGPGNTDANSQGGISFWEAGAENTWGGGLEFNSPAGTAANRLDIYGVSSSVKKTIASFDVQTGKLGIGTITPGKELDIKGVMRSQNLIIDAGLYSGNYSSTSEIDFIRNAANDRWILGSSLNSRGNNTFEFIHLTGTGTIERIFAYDYTTKGFAINNANPSSTYKFYVNGTAGGTSAWANASDRRYKKDILPITNALNKIKKMQGVGYNWRTDDFKNMDFDKKHQLGVIAQDIEKIIPEAVTKDKKGYLSVSYTTLIPVLIEAIKEQQIQISSRDKRLKILEEVQKKQQVELDDLKELVKQAIKK
ncbi:tail fiber domain-containing protein, partial [Pedobacter cryoconitis]